MNEGDREGRPYSFRFNRRGDSCGRPRFNQ